LLSATLEIVWPASHAMATAKRAPLVLVPPEVGEPPVVPLPSRVQVTAI
jgi:hypothetical protein